MESPSQKIIVEEFDFFSLVEQRLGGEVIIPCNYTNQLSTTEDKGSLNSEKQILPKKKRV